MINQKKEKRVDLPGQSKLANDTSDFIDTQEAWNISLIGSNKDYLRAVYKSHPERSIFAPNGFFDPPKEP